jgi:DNA-binding response OmpR family regulator
MSHNGTTFATVPINEVPGLPLSGKSEPYRPVILVVDDETVIADTLTEILKRSGYAAFPVYDAEEALETALVMPPEMLISDVVLPGMNGIELAIKLRRIFPDCEVILSSGQPSTARLLASAESAGNSFLFLNKPVHPEELLKQVSETLRGRKESLQARPSA